ncbi:3517_t:CDS:1 [Acaulospora morrowiae]|uniref:3517_t:CDS:1 n=1 Tax=Acaulospora morrowiae TaxID=94023 RepID=A0A9N9BH03_9GLOM|nr:3517_t:CDS:1 [Acaulospora morrowiae]
MISNVFLRTRIIGVKGRTFSNRYREITPKYFYNTLDSSGKNDTFHSQRFAKERLSNNQSWNRRNKEEIPIEENSKGYESRTEWRTNDDFQEKGIYDNSRIRNRSWNENRDYLRNDDNKYSTSNWKESYQRKDDRDYDNDSNDKDLEPADKDSIRIMNSDFGDVGDTLPQKVKRKKKEKPPPSPSISVPGFVRISGARQNMVVYFEELRRDSSKRNKFRSLLIHGYKHVQNMIKQGIPIKSIGITTAEGIKSLENLVGGSREVFNNKEKFPAERYYVADLEWTRKILGSDARVDAREIWAELPFPEIQFPSSIKKLLVLDHIADPVNMGMLIRSAKALRWDASYLISGTVDLYNDKVIRTSRCESVMWPSKAGFWHDAYAFAEEHGLTFVMAETLPRDIVPEKGSTEVCFWDPMTKEVVNEIPSRIALVLGSKLHGVTYRDVRSGILRVSIPMLNNVSSLNVGMAGNILMHELNRLMDSTQIIDETNKQNNN